MSRTAPSGALRRPRLLDVVVAIGCLLVVAPPAETQPEASEADAKAALIYAFAKFVVWPPEAISPDEPFRVAVAGAEAPLLDALIRLEAKRIHGRSIEVAAVTADDVIDAQVLYCDRATLEVLLDRPGGPPANLLIVGDEDGFAETGGIVRLMLVDDHLGFVINQTAADRSGLSLSSSLYNLAHAVLEEGDR